MSNRLRSNRVLHRLKAGEQFQGRLQNCKRNLLALWYRQGKLRRIPRIPGMHGPANPETLQRSGLHPEWRCFRWGLLRLEMRIGLRRQSPRDHPRSSAVRVGWEGRLYQSYQARIKPQPAVSGWHPGRRYPAIPWLSHNRLRRRIPPSEKRCPPVQEARGKRKRVTLQSNQGKTRKRTRRSLLLPGQRLGPCPSRLRMRLPGRKTVSKPRDWPIRPRPLPNRVSIER